MLKAPRQDFTRPVRASPEISGWRWRFRVQRLRQRKHIGFRRSVDPENEFGDKRLPQQNGHHRRSLKEPKADIVCSDGPFTNETDLMPPARAYIGVLDGYGSPIAVNLAQNTGTNAGALGLVNVAINAKLGMHHRHVRR